MRITFEGPDLIVIDCIIFGLSEPGLLLFNEKILTTELCKSKLAYHIIFTLHIFFFKFA